MKDRFKNTEVEMTLEEKFNLVCSAIGAKASDVTGPDTSRRHAGNRAFVANFLSEYVGHGLSGIMHRSPVTVYSMIQRVNMKRIRQEPEVLRLDKLLESHIDRWLKR